MKPLASIIIIVKNDAGIERTLGMLQLQPGIERAEIIVIDASKPQTLAHIRARFTGVRWEHFVQSGKQFTIPEQRNRGIELAVGSIIVFIDANCEPGEYWLTALLGAIQGGEDIVCGPCRPSNATNLVHYTAEHSQPTYIDECTTMNVAFRRGVYDSIGPFDSSFSYGSDVDFFWRARDKGFRICYEPAAYVTHDYGDMHDQSRRAFRYGRARAKLHRKHWRKHLSHLLFHESHVWAYPLFMLSLPIAIVKPQYSLVLLLLLVPIVKNRSIGVVAHHLLYGVGVIVGALLIFDFI